MCAESRNPHDSGQRYPARTSAPKLRRITTSTPEGTRVANLHIARRYRGSGAELRHTADRGHRRTREHHPRHVHSGRCPELPRTTHRWWTTDQPTVRLDGLAATRRRAHLWRLTHRRTVGTDRGALRRGPRRRRVEPAHWQSEPRCGRDRGRCRKTRRAPG